MNRSCRSCSRMKPVALDHVKLAILLRLPSPHPWLLGTLTTDRHSHPCPAPMQPCLPYRHDRCCCHKPKQCQTLAILPWLIQRLVRLQPLLVVSPKLLVAFLSSLCRLLVSLITRPMPYSHPGMLLNPTQTLLKLSWPPRVVVFRCRLPSIMSIPRRIIMHPPYSFCRGSQQTLMHPM